MRLYAGDYSEKIALRSGQSDRLVAIIIIIAAFLVFKINLTTGLESDSVISHQMRNFSILTNKNTIAFAS